MSLFTLTAPAGGGKTTIMKRLLQEMPESKLLRSVTTRHPRANDAEGEYLYITESEFRTHAERNDFAWETAFSSGLYGTLKSDLRHALASDRVHFAAIVPQIIPKLHAFAAVEGVATRVRSVYLKSPGPDILLRRLTIDRGEPIDVANAKIQECLSWDALAHSTGTPTRETANGWRPTYRFIDDDDDLEEKYRAVLVLAQRPW